MGSTLTPPPLGSSYTRVHDQKIEATEKILMRRAFLRLNVYLQGAKENNEYLPG
jgi:hypothetical protein